MAVPEVSATARPANRFTKMLFDLIIPPNPIRPERTSPAARKVPEIGRIVNHIRGTAATEPGAAKRRCKTTDSTNRNSAPFIRELAVV